VLERIKSVPLRADSRGGTIRSSRNPQSGIQLNSGVIEKMNIELKRLIANQFRNTSLGFLRIKRNLGIINFSDSETEDFLRKIILSTPLPNIETKGKNHYFKCFEYNAILTINAYSFTIITAKQIDKILKT